MQTHPAAPVVYMPPSGPGAGACSTLLSVEVQSVSDAVVMSCNMTLELLCLVRVPIALNATVPPVGTAPGPVLDTVVLVAAGRGVNVGVILGVFVGVADGSGEAVKVGVAGGPFAIVMESSEKPGVGDAVEVPLLPPLQLSRTAPKTNNTTGAATSHLSHLDIIEP